MNIKFTLEYSSITGSLSLLDLKLNITEEGEIHIEFYRKAASKDMFVQYNSALPLGAKIGYARNELAHIQGKCSKTEDKVTHTTCFLDILKTNRYPRSIVNQLKYPRRPTHRTHRKPSNTCFLKIPHFSKRITRSIRRAIRREGLDIQLAHSGPSLRGHLAKKQAKDSSQCTLANCPIRDTDLCQRVNVYRIQCNKCNKFYVGSTTRPLHVHIKEHLNTRASSIGKHLDRCQNTDKSITVTIEANERNLGNLRIKEAILIHRLGPQINNGLEVRREAILQRAQERVARYEQWKQSGRHRATVTPHRTKSTTGLHMSSPSASAPVKPREMRTPRKPRPASLAGTLPGFVPLEVPKASTPRSKSSERISKDKLRNRSSTIDSAKSDKSVSSTASTQSKSSRKAIFDRLSTPKKPTDTPPKSTEKKSSAPNSGTTTPTPRKPKSTKDKGPRESPNREGTPTPSAPEDQMTRSTQDITEEEYKIKLAEKRRQAREKAEREAELERQRQEELRRQEEERIRLEEEEQRRLEEESIRLAAEGRLAEEERLRKAIEAEEQRKKEEADRLELERKQKEEAEKKAKEEADRLEKERVERAKKEEEERLARKKRLEMIMKRVKTEPNVVDTVKVESSTKSAQSSPSRSSNSSTELSPDERQEEASTTLVANDMKKASSQEDMQNIEEERTAAKFKSPLLKQLMDKRSDDSSGDTSAKFKSPILQNILGKSKTNLGNRLLKTNSSEKLASSQESLDQPFAEDSTSLKDISRQKNDVDTNAEVNPAENSLVDKDKSQNRLSVSFDQSVGMDDSGFADSNGSTKTPQIVDVNGTGRSVELSSESAIGSLVDNNLDNKDKVELTTISGESSWSTTPKQSPISHLNKPLSGITVASDCDSLARSSENQIGTLIDLSVTNKNIDLKSQQLQDNLLNNTDDLLNFNSVNSATGDHKNTLLPFEDNAPQRQDVSELI
uniref:GIY-YIG domain-containing protein n=1 Tax=Octopus bimaculoides TaxID=37653 RepID=A0A0L8GYC4_OCTBM